MRWNWQQPTWPNFRFDAKALAPSEARFLQQGGVLIGTREHLAASDREQVTIDLITQEALTSAQIEGEILDRDSVQSSLRRQFGLQSDHRGAPPAEQGMVEVLVDLYRNFAAPLTETTLFDWHRQLMSGRQDLDSIGVWRSGDEPMQVVSGPIYAPNIHFEAPPSSAVPAEMARFQEVFARTAPDGPEPLPALTRAGLLHLHFVSIHPFEDGNGRIARALSEKTLAQSLGQASLIALSAEINRRRKAYYEMLERSNKGDEITPWLVWFADTALAAQASAQEWVAFLLAKTKLFDRLRGQLNPRQEKALLRLFRAGPEGFTGGLSAGNYISLTGASPATARRDLGQLVELGALRRTGERKHTRYWLEIP